MVNRKYKLLLKADIFTRNFTEKSTQYQKSEIQTSIFKRRGKKRNKRPAVGADKLSHNEFIFWFVL